MLSVRQNTCCDESFVTNDMLRFIKLAIFALKVIADKDILHLSVFTLDKECAQQNQDRFREVDSIHQLI